MRWKYTAHIHKYFAVLISKRSRRRRDQSCTTDEFMTSDVITIFYQRFLALGKNDQNLEKSRMSDRFQRLTIYSKICNNDYFSRKAEYFLFYRKILKMRVDVWWPDSNIKFTTSE